MNSSAQEVVGFWREAGPGRWFRRDREFDREIKRRFSDAVSMAAAGALQHWLDEPESALALILVLDQFPRNIHRGSDQAYAYDPLAMRAAEGAIARGHDMAYAAKPELRRFFYIPFMHSEDPVHQDYCVRLLKEAGDDEGLRHAQEHAEIIHRFGRFPHRNAILGRISRPEEDDFLASGGFSG